MVTLSDKTERYKPRVVVCSAEGLLAGDLAALLVRDFEVESVRTWPDLIQTMERSVQALILLMDASPFIHPNSVMQNQIKEWETRVLVLAVGTESWRFKDFNYGKCFVEMPTCQKIVEALDRVVPLEKKSTG